MNQISKEKALEVFDQYIIKLQHDNYLRDDELIKLQDILHNLNLNLDSANFDKVFTSYLIKYRKTQIGGVLAVCFKDVVKNDGCNLIESGMFENVAYLPPNYVIEILTSQENTPDFFSNVARRFAKVAPVDSVDDFFEIYKKIIPICMRDEIECELVNAPVFREYHINAILERLIGQMDESEFYNFERELNKIALQNGRGDLCDFYNIDTYLADRVYNLVKSPEERVKILLDTCFSRVNKNNLPSRSVFEVIIDSIEKLDKNKLMQYKNILNRLPEVEKETDSNYSLLFSAIGQFFRTHEVGEDDAKWFMQKMKISNYYQLYSDEIDARFKKELEQFENKILKERPSEAFKILDVMYKSVEAFCPDVFMGIYYIVKKYHKISNIFEFGEFLKNNPVVVDYIEQISFRKHILAHKQGLAVEKILGDLLRDFASVYSKTRNKELVSPEVALLTNIKWENFDLNMWRKFVALPQFKSKIGQFVAINLLDLIGGFENDANKQKRVDTLYNYFLRREYVLSGSELDKLSTSLPIEFVLLNNLLSIMPEKSPRIKNINEFKEKYLTKTYKCVYKMRDGVKIPKEYEIFFNDKEVSEKLYKSFFKQTGNSGNKLVTFLSPYKFENGNYVLRNTAVIPHELTELSSIISKERYFELLEQNEYAKFLNPIEKIQQEAYKLKPDVPNEVRELFIQSIMDSQIETEFTYLNLIEKFLLMPCSYQEGFSEFLLDNLDLFFTSSVFRKNLDGLKTGYKQASEIFKLSGNKLTLNALLSYIKQTDFIAKFGFSDFAKQAFKAGVNSQSSYEYYEKVFARANQRMTSTIPTFKKIYHYKTNGKAYKYEVEILPLHDARNVLIGEKNYLDSCQKVGFAGQSCLEHASMSPNGRIVLVSEINKDGTPTLLGASWAWTNKNKLTFDNFEATLQYIKSPSSEKTITDEHICDILAKISKLIIKSNESEIKKYIKKRKLSKSAAQNLEKQKINLVTIGDCYDSINIADKFTPYTDACILPKGYTGYSDINKGASRRERVILDLRNGKQNSTEESYEEVLLFEEERRTNEYLEPYINDAVIKKVQEMEKDNLLYHNINSLQGLKQKLNIDGEVSVILGKDWFIVKSHNENGIVIEDICLSESTDKVSQKTEIIQAIKNQILKASGKLIIKPTANTLINTTIKKFSKRGKLQKISQQEYNIRNK